MSSPFLDLLKSIDQGITIYEPFNRGARGMTEFQDLAARLIEMQQLGLVASLFKRQREIAGVEFYDLVMVTGGGLTTEGERLLAENRGHKKG